MSGGENATVRPDAEIFAEIANLSWLGKLPAANQLAEESRLRVRWTNGREGVLYGVHTCGFGQVLLDDGRELGPAFQHLELAGS